MAHELIVSAVTGGAAANSWTISGTGIFTGENFAGGVNGLSSVTAENLKNAINARSTLQDLVTATRSSNIVTVEVKIKGTDGNNYELSVIDNATMNFTLSGVNFTGGEDALPAILIDTDLLHSGATTNILDIRHAGNPFMSFRRDTSNPLPFGWGPPVEDVQLWNLYDKTGALITQWILDDPFMGAGTVVLTDSFKIATGSNYLTVQPGGSQFWHTDQLDGGGGEGLVLENAGYSSRRTKLGAISSSASSLILSQPTRDTIGEVAPSTLFHAVLMTNYDNDDGGYIALDGDGRFGGASGGSGSTNGISWDFLSCAQDNANAIGYNLNTHFSLTVAGAKLLSLKNTNSEKAYIDKDGNTAIEGEFKIKLYSQASQPTLSANEFMAMWKDTDDSNRIYLVFRRGSGDHVKVELT